MPPWAFGHKSGTALAWLAGWAGLGLPLSAQTGGGSPSAPDPIEGRWTGTVADIGFEFFRTETRDLAFRLNFPAMFTYNVAFGIPVTADGLGHYSITPAFATELRLRGDELTGTFSPGKLPLRLHRGGAFLPAPPVPVYPAPPARLWRYRLDSPTWAPPVVRGGTVYLGTSAGCFHAVRAADGRPVWTWQGSARLDGGASVSDDSVYFLDSQMQLTALDRATGSRRWQVSRYDRAFAGRPIADDPTFNHRAVAPRGLNPPRCCGTE